MPAPPGESIVQATSNEDLEKCFAIRLDVFVREQGVPREEELDGHEAECRHFLVFQGAEAIATGRLRPVGDAHVKFERVRRP